MKVINPPGPPIRERIVAIILDYMPAAAGQVADDLANHIVAGLELTQENSDTVSRALGMPRRVRWVTPYERAE